MYNDGINFFGTTADYKIPRLLGRKPGWFDKCRPGQSLFLALISTSILVYILYTEIGMYNEIKS